MLLQQLFYNSTSHTASLAACDIEMAKCALSIQNKNYAQLGTLSLYLHISISMNVFNLQCN